MLPIVLGIMHVSFPTSESHEAMLMNSDLEKAMSWNNYYSDDDRIIEKRDIADKLYVLDEFVRDVHNQLWDLQVRVDALG